MPAPPTGKGAQGPRPRPQHSPGPGHHDAVLHHERVADGRHQREGLLAGRVPPHQAQQGVGLLLRVQLLQTLLSDAERRQPPVLLKGRGAPPLATSWQSSARRSERCHLKVIRIATNNIRVSKSGTEGLPHPLQTRRHPLRRAPLPVERGHRHAAAAGGLTELAVLTLTAGSLHSVQTALD